MHAKFQVTGFQNKRDIRHRFLDFVCLFLLGHLLVQVTWWIFASDGSEIQASMEQLKLHLKHMLPTFSYFNKVLCIRGMWVGYSSIHRLLYLHVIIAIALKTRNAYSSKLL